VSIVRTRDRDDPVEEFEDFVRANFADVWRFVRRRVDGTADADDVTAEVFATAWRRRDESPPDDERRLWLFGVARLVLRNHLRSGVRRDRLHLRLVDGATDTVEPDERDDTVWQELASLDADDRDLLIMRAWDGLAVNDIAVVLGISANAASQRMAKARTRLAAALAAVEVAHDGSETAGVGPASPAGRIAAGGIAEPGRTNPRPARDTDHGGTGHAPVEPATATAPHPGVSPRHTEENGNA
jgi:RNA polymerase sigma-70 factor, ECF subfamily